ncbi:hypothetical protein ACLOJK_011391 [Asimina triloba]
MGSLYSGRFDDGRNEDVADDHYHRYDVKQGGCIGIILAAFWYKPLRDILVDKSAAKCALASETPS